MLVTVVARSDVGDDSVMSDVKKINSCLRVLALGTWASVGAVSTQ